MKRFMKIVNFNILSVIIGFFLLSCDWNDDNSEMKLVFNRDNEIWLYDLKTEKLKKLVAVNEIVYTNEKGTIYSRQWAGGAKWSPNGKKIVFIESVATDAQNMKLMNMETQKQEFFPNYIYRQDGSVEWSTDGKQLVFSKSIASLGLNYELFIINADRTNETQLTDRPFHTDVWPSLHPNGIEIIFISKFKNTSDYFQVYHTTVFGDTVNQLTEAVRFTLPPKFNPKTGEIIYAIKNIDTKKTVIWKVSDIKFTDPVQLAAIDVPINDLTWSNDGELIVFVRFAGGTHGPYTNPEIWMMNGDGTNKKLIIKNGSGPSLWVNN